MRAFLLDESGSTAIEYAMIASIISIAILTGVTLIGTTLSGNYYGPVADGLQ